MLPIQIIILAFIAFAILKIFLKFKEGAITTKELILWIVFWLITAVIIALPKTTGILAGILGVGRGTDVIIYLSITLLFYIIFRMQVRMENIEREITKIVRDQTLNKKQ